MSIDHSGIYMSVTKESLYREYGNPGHHQMTRKCMSELYRFRWIWTDKGFELRDGFGWFGDDNLNPAIYWLQN